jgi:hypothetical protein
MAKLLKNFNWFSEYAAQNSVFYKNSKLSNKTVTIANIKELLIFAIYKKI